MADLRKCTVKFKTNDGTERTMWGFFHCWEQISQIMAPSPIRGGHPGGVVSQMYGLVEDAETGKVWRCDPPDISFEHQPKKWT